jgi:hypothetical protein
MMNDLINGLKEGIIEVTFEKINDGGTRVMPCTLNSDIIEQETGNKMLVKDIDAASSNIAVWGCDVRAWRSFRVSTMTNWRPLPEFEMGDHHEAKL